MKDNISAAQGEVSNSEVESKKDLDIQVERLEDQSYGTNVEFVDLATEKAITRKLDWKIIPMIMWVYLMNMMDRVNIGNARLYNMEGELGLKGNEFQLAVAVLFITYCLLEAPSNLIIKKMRPAWYLAGLTMAWGFVATFSSFVQNLAGLVICRLLLGVCEAGFFPGVVLYLSMFYGRRNLAMRIAWFFSTASWSGIAGGLVAYGISFMDGYGGWRAWRWIIVINGLPTLVTGVVIPFVLPNSPETAKFLTEEDRRNLRLCQEQQMGKARNLRELDMADVKAAIWDWTTWAYCFALFPCLAMLYSFTVFLPTIIKQMGAWNAAEVQALTVPIYAVGAIVYLICARFSDIWQKRGYFVMGAIITAIIGYAMLISNKGTGVSYAGCCFVSVGIFVSAGISFAWVPSNNPRYGKRAFSTGMHLTFGNASGVLSPFLFSNKDAPTYRPGYGASMGMLVVSFALNAALTWHFKRVNKRRDEGKEDHILEGKTDLELDAMGEMNPRFRFII